MLKLNDKWVWDFWTLKVGDQWHCWFLQADKALGDEGLRHWNVSCGHAISTDLVNWTHLGTSFEVAPGPAWDDMTVWTGSVVRPEADGLFHLFYTGNCQADGGRRQRIGHATSSDGHHWQRVGSGLILDLLPGDPVSALYEEFNNGPWDGRAMRDPWVMKDPHGPGWLMYFTARVNRGEEMNTRGAIGLARSDDLDRWTLQPPVYAGGHYGQLEVPQVFELGGRWYMVFCNAGDHWSRAVVDEHAAAGHGGPQWGSHYLMAEHPLGPWRLPGTAFLDGAMPCARYAAKVIQSGNGPVLMGFLYWGSQGESNGRFIGELCDPVPVRVDAVTGQLRIGSSADV